MNNKGMTLIELLVTFTLLLVIVVGMFNLILDLRMDLDNKKIVENYTEYSNYMNKDIEQDLITRQPLAFAIKENKTKDYCYNNNIYSALEACQIDGDNNFVFSVYLTQLSEDNVLVQGSKSMTELCADMYPCAVYAYYDKNNISSSLENISINVQYQVIALKKEILEGDTTSQYGIKYGNFSKVIYETIPDQKYIDINKLSKASISANESSFIIDFPLYLTGDTQNHGFKIVYPLAKLPTEDFK